MFLLAISVGLAVIRVEYFVPIPILSFLIFVPGLIRTLLLQDRLYEGLYTNHREIWEAIGRPRGWQWQPPGVWFGFPDFATSFTFLSKTDPDWLGQTPELRDLFYACRAGVRRWNFVAMLTFVAGSLFFGLICYLFPTAGR